MVNITKYIIIAKQLQKKEDISFKEALVKSKDEKKESEQAYLEQKNILISNVEIIQRG